MTVQLLFAGFLPWADEDMIRKKQSQVDEIAFIASPIRVYTLRRKHASLADFVNARDLINATWHTVCFWCH